MEHISRRVAALVGAAVLLSTALLAPVDAAPAEPAAAVPVIRLDGRGHGHGVGMSQWGAYTMARNGATAADIIGAFYPGTELGQAAGEVVVVVDRRDHVRIRFPGGGEVRSSRSGEQHPGFPVSVPPGGTVDVVRTAEGYRVSGDGVAPLSGRAAVRYTPRQQDCVLVVCPPGDSEPPPTPATPTTKSPPSSDEPGGPEPAEPAPAPPPEGGGEPPPPPPGAVVSPTPVWGAPAGGSTVAAVDRGRSYRGLLEVTGPPGGVAVRNHVDVEDYLRGMAEVPGTWPAAAVQAQAVAARTYAMRAMATGGELCDGESCQVYRGVASESAGQSAAVEATRGVVVRHGGSFAATFYSASAGGFTATVAEGFGSGGAVAYLPARPYETVRPDVWTIDVALRDVAGRLGYPGVVRSVTVDETGPSGRPLRLTLHGDAGPRPVDPQEFRRRLGLRSTLFTVRTAEVEAAPPPPPEAPDAGVVGTEPQVPELLLNRAPADIDPLSAEPEVALVAPSRASERPAWVLALATALVAITGVATALALGRSPRWAPATMAAWRSRVR